MHYKCTKCGYEAWEYLTRSECCPNCGHTVLAFEHLEFNDKGTMRKGGSHWVLINTKTEEVLSNDPCDILADKILSEVERVTKS